MDNWCGLQTWFFALMVRWFSPFEVWFWTRVKIWFLFDAEGEEFGAFEVNAAELAEGFGTTSFIACIWEDGFTTGFVPFALGWVAGFFFLFAFWALFRISCHKTISKMFNGNFNLYCGNVTRLDSVDNYYNLPKKFVSIEIPLIHMV